MQLWVIASKGISHESATRLSLLSSLAWHGNHLKHRFACFCDNTTLLKSFFSDSCQLLSDFLLCCFFWRYCLYEMTGQFCYISKTYIYIQRSSKHSTTRTEDFGNAVLVEPGRVANGKLERLRFRDCIWWANGDIRNGDAVYYIFVVFLW